MPVPNLDQIGSEAQSHFPLGVTVRQRAVLCWFLGSSAVCAMEKAVLLHMYLLLNVLYCVGMMQNLSGPTFGVRLRCFTSCDHAP